MADKHYYDPNRLIDNSEKSAHTVSSKNRTSINSGVMEPLKGAPFQGKPDPNVNFSKLFLISVSFLGMYIALYSAQNVQSVLFEDDHYDSLGFLSNAFAYAG